MTPHATRNLRAGLLALLVLVLAAVAWSLRKSGASAPSGGPKAASESGTTSTGLVLRDFREGEERFLVEAESSQGQEKEGLRLRGVKATFHYRAQGKAHTATISADECLCEPEPQRAAFRGHVEVKTDDGLELSTASLTYRGQDGVAESTDDVAFRRGKVSGRGTGARYEARAGRLELLADVRLHIEQEGKPGTDIQAGRAVAERAADTLDFSGGVVVREGSDWLEAAQLTLGFLGDFEVVTRALAKDDVRVQTADAQVLPGVKGSPMGKGGRRLACRKLDIGFRPEGTLQQAVASGGHDEAGNPLYADLELLPDPKGPPERRRLQARVIVFRFEEQGRLEALQGQLGTVLSSEPRRPGESPARTARSETLDAVVDPATGSMTTANLEGSVELVQGRQRATARKGRYDPAKETLFLTGEARVVDEEQGSDLQAEAIDLGPGRDAAAARGGVIHTVAVRKTGPHPGLLSRDDPAIFRARFFEYDGATRTARYRENALLRSGRDEVRAPLIVLEEPAAGQRRLKGSGGVASVLHPRPRPGAQKGPEAVETRSQEMVYDEARSRITYTGEVVIRQGDIRSKSPEAVVTLSADGSAVERLEAGQPVEVEQGARKATGTKGTYTPRDETFVLVGEKVEVQDAKGRVGGRTLTFHVGDDRIRIDGQEEVRTESIFKREPPKR
jgi:LPS export ABC transporter protein LptC/lipopolysaccharide transport protein LptA